MHVVAKPCCFHEHYHGLDHAHPISLFAVSGPSLLAFKYKTCKSMASAYQLWQPAALSQLRGGPRRQLYTIGSKDENVCQSEPKCVSSFFKQCRIKYKKSTRMDWNTPNPKASLTNHEPALARQFLALAQRQLPLLRNAPPLLGHLISLT